MSESFLSKVEGLAREVVQREGCEFYDVEFSGTGRYRVLRVYIDKPEGVKIEDCTNVSRGLNLILDVEDIVPGGEYSLEVSSPGLERVLRHPSHFVSVMGQEIWIKARDVLETYGMENRGLCKGKQVQGVLSSVSEGSICLQVEAEMLEIPFDRISKSKVVFDFNKKQDG